MKNDTLAKRLNKAMSARQVSQTELSQLTGISKSAISQYLSGKSEPKQKYVEIICDALKISDLWLYGENVPMDIDEFSDYYSKQCLELNASIELKIKKINHIYDMCCQLTADGLTIADEFIKFIYSQKKYKSNLAISPFFKNEDDYLERKKNNDEFAKNEEELKNDPKLMKEFNKYF